MMVKTLTLKPGYLIFTHDSKSQSWKTDECKSWFKILTPASAGVFLFRTWKFNSWGILSFVYWMNSYWLLDAEIGNCGGILAGEFEMDSCWLLDIGLRPLLPCLFAWNARRFSHFFLLIFDFFLCFSFSAKTTHINVSTHISASGQMSQQSLVHFTNSI